MEDSEDTPTGPTMQATNATQSIYYAKNIFGAGAGVNTVTVIFNVPATSPDLRILEYAGADQTNPLDEAGGEDRMTTRYATSTDKEAFSDQCFAAAQAFKMPHVIYGLQHAFFEDGPWSALDEVMPQLARAFSFDMQLLGRLVSVASSRGSTNIPQVTRPQA